MKKLVMSVLLLGALSQAAGCIIVSDDTSGDDVVDETGTIDVSWDLRDGNDPAACGAADTATVYALLAGDTTPYEDRFDCVDGGGAAMDLPLGTYTVWVDLTNTDGSVLFAQSESVEVSLDTPGEVITADFRIDVANGFFDVSWEFTNAADCSAIAGQTGVSVLSTLAGPNEGFDDIFTCSDGVAPSFVTTAPLPIGDYTVIVDVVNSQNQSLGTSGTIQDTIDHGNDFEWLGNDGEPVAITVD